MLEELMKIRTELATYYEQVRAGISWYNAEAQKLKNLLEEKDKLILEKDKEILELKSKLNEKSS